MNFEFTEPQTPIEHSFGGFTHINAFGRIDTGDGKRFEVFLKRASPPPLTCVYLNTPGGSVPDGMEIGRWIRRHNLGTSVGSYLFGPPSPRDLIIRSRNFVPGVCASSGTLAFLGGRQRWLPRGSEFRVHRFRFSESVEDVLGPSQQTSAAIANYLLEMGISSRFLEVSASVHHDDTLSLSADALLELGVINNGITDTTWTTEAKGGSFYIRGQRDTMFGYQKILIGYYKTGGFYVHAVFESQNRDQELINFPLVELTMNNETTRIDITNRALREIINGFMNVVVLVSQEEAKQIIESRGIGVQIRASSTADLFFGIRDMPINDDGMEKLDSLLLMFSR